MVKRVGQDAFGAFGSLGVLTHQTIKCGGGVEHHRPEFAGLLGVGAEVEMHTSGLVAESVGKAQRIGQAAGGVDGDNHDSFAKRRSVHRNGRRRSGLADAARTTAHDDLGVAQHDVER